MERKKNKLSQQKKNIKKKKTFNFLCPISTTVSLNFCMHLKLNNFIHHLCFIQLPEKRPAFHQLLSFFEVLREDSRP